MNTKINLIEEYDTLDLIKTDINNTKKNKLKDIPYLIFKSIPSILGEDIEPTAYDPSTYPKFKSIKGSPLSKHKIFGEMDISELVEYAKQSESNRKEARDLFEKEYYWWMQNCKDYVMIAGFGDSFTTKWFTDSIQKLKKDGKDPFDVETFNEWLSKHDLHVFRIIINLLRIIGWSWFVWHSLNNL